MTLTRASELKRITVDFVGGHVSAVTAKRSHWIEEDGRPVGGTGSEADEDVPFGSAEGQAFAALIGKVNAGLVAKVAEMDAQVKDAEAKVEALSAEAAEATPSET